MSPTCEIDWKFSHDALMVFLMKHNLLAFFPMTGENQWRIVGTFPEEFAKDEGEVLYEEIEEQIKKDAELELDITKVNWFSTYKVHTRHVSKFSRRQMFSRRRLGAYSHARRSAGNEHRHSGRLQSGVENRGGFESKRRAKKFWKPTTKNGSKTRKIC